ncbi:RNA polymerase sigma-70 factor, ECF subfamily [bacterium A37T11]|nr:RNA polymerase sigma-70 factor, ECF subfamily [bacterium A37T11]
MTSNSVGDESEWLLRLQKGDETALAALYSEFAAILYNRIIKLVHLHEAAEEIVQDVFLNIWNQRHSMDTNTPVLAILMQSAKSLAINYYRKAIRDKQLREQLAVAGTECYDPLNDQLNFIETSAQVSEAIARLPEQRKKIFTYCKLEGNSYADAAQLFGISVGTVKDHMAKAVRFLRGVLK